MTATRQLSSGSRRRWVALLVFLVVVAVCFWPITTLSSPLWKVLVVDQEGKPVDGIMVALDFQNYSAESSGHMEWRQTDATGRVVFPPHTLRASAARRVIEILKSATGGVHASFGPHAGVWADGKSLSGSATAGKWVTDWKGSPAEMSSTIVVKPKVPWKPADDSHTHQP